MPVPAAVPAPPQPGQPGWLLGGRYRVIDRIGSGGMAEVFRAHDQLLARDVAVKVFRAHTDPDEVTGGVQRQELELQTLARLSHPNLITLFDGSIGSAGEPAFLVMELINGPSLAAQIAQAPLTEPETREIAIQIAGALAYVHSQHMVHRDIKPANILLGADGVTSDTAIGAVRARLSDFGIVRLLGSERLTSADFMIGTASYLAPEQARGAEVGPPADVYALGLVLIEALTGRRSYEGPALEAVLARLDRSPEIPAGLPQPWPDLLSAMTATDPELRPSAAEVARTLRDGAAIAAPLLAVSGSELLAGDAVLAGGAPLAAASGMAGTAALAHGAGFAGSTGLVGDAGIAGNGGSVHGAGIAGAAGLAGAGIAGAGFTAAPAGMGLASPAGAASPDLPTEFISSGLSPMPPPVDEEPYEPAESHPLRAAAPRGPLVGTAVAGAFLLISLTAGGLLLVRDPASKDPSSTLPGQSVSSSVNSKQPGTKPSSTPTSLAPIGSVPSAGTGGTTARTSVAAPTSSAPPSSSSAAPTSSAPPPSSSAAPTSSAPPPTSSAAPTSSAPPPSSSAAPSISVSPSASGTGTSTAAPATSTAVPAGGSPAPSTTVTKPKKQGG